MRLSDFVKLISLIALVGVSAITPGGAGPDCPQSRVF